MKLIISENQYNKLKQFVSEQIGEEYKTSAWQRKEGKVGGKAGLNKKGVTSYRRENPGSKLQTAVTEKDPSDSRKKRRSSFCARNRGTMDAHNVDCRETPNKKSCINHRRWRCTN